MFSLIKHNTSKAILFLGLQLFGIILLVNGGIKAIFILSNESAVQKAEVLDVVLGTMSLGLTLLGLLPVTLVAFEVIIKKKEFKKIYVLALLGTAGLFIIASILVIVKDHTNWVTDWAKLNDIEKARSDIASNLSLGNVLVEDRWGNKPNLLNTLNVTEYNDFVTQAISSKQDLASLYPVDELLNKVDEPLIAAKLVDGLAAAWQADHSVTAHSYFASTSTTNAYDFLNVAKSLRVGMENPLTFKVIHALLNQPVVFTGLTVATLQGYPLDLTVICGTLIVVVLHIILGKVQHKGAH